jgi:hypothetical protein
MNETIETMDQIENIENIENIEKNNVYTEDPLLKSIKLNYIFYSLLLICLFVISYYTNSTFLSCIITFIYVSVNGYFFHYLSHKINFIKIFYTSDSTKFDNYLYKIPGMDNFIYFLFKMFDFHSETHHDTTINKQFQNKIYEFIINFMTQTGILLLFILFTKYLNCYVCFLWGFLYSTVHLINYDIIKPISHKHHHLNVNTNYDIFLWDTIFNTKYDYQDIIEDVNHCSYNLVILTILIVLFIKYNNFIKK